MTREWTDQDIEKMLRAYFQNQVPEGTIAREELHILLEQDNVRLKKQQGVFLRELEHIQELIWFLDDEAISDIQRQKTKNCIIAKLKRILPEVIELLKL